MTESVILSNCLSLKEHLFIYFFSLSLFIFTMQNTITMTSDEQQAPPSWDQLRKEARQLESEIEVKLSTLAKIGQSTGLDNTGQEAETDELLKKVNERRRE